MATWCKNVVYWLKTLAVKEAWRRGGHCAPATHYLACFRCACWMSGRRFRFILCLWGLFYTSLPSIITQQSLGDIDEILCTFLQYILGAGLHVVLSGIILHCNWQGHGKGNVGSWDVVYWHGHSWNHEMIAGPKWEQVQSSETPWKWEWVLAWTDSKWLLYQNEGRLEMITLSKWEWAQNGNGLRWDTIKMTTVSNWECTLLSIPRSTKKMGQPWLFYNTNFDTHQMP